VVSFTPRPLYSQGKSPWYPFDRRLDGPQSRSGRDDDDDDDDDDDKLTDKTFLNVAKFQVIGNEIKR
jgi:hypothetical protein